MMRSDGWFPRQYSVAGVGGTHDLREYVDSGWWVWELFYEYLCQTRDFSVLNEAVGYLDSDAKSTVIEHACQLLGYALHKDNLGEHGLLKIREGDWNDSVNRAGVLGRGESVMASAQVVLALTQAVETFSYLLKTKVITHSLKRSLEPLIKKYKTAMTRMIRALLIHARNQQGYFNGVFNDAGKWCFSPCDPDGRSRINGPVNSFAVIAGIVGGAEREQVFEALNSLKTDVGWLLFSPAIGNPPIEHLGRIGSGDLAEGLGENGTPYNHGSHGFLGRACWTAGKGNMLRDVLCSMLPYDQRAHPVGRSLTAPYAVVNHWRTAPGMTGEGGDTFLSGSISTALRNIWHGLVGFRPDVEGLVLDPCIPTDWKEVHATVSHLGKTFRMAIHNPNGVSCGVHTVRVGKDLYKPNRVFKQGGRKVICIPAEDLEALSDKSIDVIVTLGA